MAKKRLLKEDRTELLFKNASRLRKALDKKRDIGMMMGLDPGRNKPGIALQTMSLDNNKKPVTITHSITTRCKGFSKVMEVEAWVGAELDSSEPLLVMMEDYSFGSEFGREKAGEMHGAIMRLIWKAGVPLIKVAPSQIKSFIGAMDKDHIMKEVLRKYEIDTKSSDEADAVVLVKIGDAIVRIMNTMSSITEFDDQKKFEANPHRYCNLVQKEAKIAVNLLIEKGETAIEFATEAEKYRIR
jgi:Holliday junction resolvasome RuvABC endonuclease subunit